MKLSICENYMQNISQPHHKTKNKTLPFNKKCSNDDADGRGGSTMETVKGAGGGGGAYSVDGSGSAPPPPWGHMEATSLTWEYQNFAYSRCKVGSLPFLGGGGVCNQN